MQTGVGRGVREGETETDSQGEGTDRKAGAGERDRQARRERERETGRWRKVESETDRQRCRVRGELVRAGNGGSGEAGQWRPAGALHSTGDQPLPGALRLSFPISARVLDPPHTHSPHSPTQDRGGSGGSGRGRARSTVSRAWTLDPRLFRPIHPAPAQGTSGQQQTLPALSSLCLGQ